MAPISESVAVALVTSCVYTGGLLTMVFALLICAKRKQKAKHMTKIARVDGRRKHQAGTKQTDHSAAHLGEHIPVSSSASVRRRQQMAEAAVSGNLSFSVTDVLRIAIKDKQKLDRLMIDSNRLSLEYTIGRGNFGAVLRGTLLDKKLSNPRTVAVKTVEGSKCTRENAEAFIQESARMAEFQHENILALIGVTVKNNKPYIILPYMEEGDLHSYIVDTRRKLTLENLVGFAYDVSKGMAYLASKRFIHRDLAARNCMISSDMKVRVGDFGLSRDLFESDYYRMANSNTQLPLRWVALESIYTAKFTIKSDIWSYGVLFWELMTRGIQPYSEITDNVEVIKFLMRGGRLTFPQYVPSDLSTFIEKCWHRDPQNRPDFGKIVSFLHDLLAA